MSDFPFHTCGMGKLEQFQQGASRAQFISPHHNPGPVHIPSDLYYALQLVMNICIYKQTLHSIVDSIVFAF